MSGGADLFSELPLSGVAKRREGRIKFIGSVVIHTAVVAALVLIPLLWPEELPEAQDGLRILIFNPPPAAAAPMLRGSSLVQKTEAPKKVAEKEIKKPKEPERKPEFVVPIEIPKEAPKEQRVAANEQYGSETGSDLGLAEGMEGGVDGGVAGGILGGVVGGCVGCTGDGPVLDYDQPPRPIRPAEPKMSQEAFVKKIEGVVPVEVLIDATGAVVRVRILRSIPALDAEAVACAKRWLFAPATKRGRAVASLAQINIAFRLY